MQWIPEYLTKNKTETSDDQTLPVDLPKNEQISFLHMEVSAENAGTLTTTQLIDAIEKYEIIADGSKVLYSLEPELAYYTDFVTHDGLYPPVSFNLTSQARDTHQFIIPFGRHEFDEEYLLDTSLYNSVQLRIPYDISDTDVHNTGTFRHNVVMYRPLEKLSPVGFIRSRCIRKETVSAAVQTINHDLPMTFPLRYVACRFEDIDANITSDCTAIKVNIDEGRLILADLNINEWRDRDKVRYPEKNYYQLIAGWQDATGVKCHVDYPYPRAGESSGIAPLMWKLSAAAGEQCAMNLYLHDGSTATGGHAILFQFGGANPHKCLTVLDGREQPLNVAQYTEGKIEYTLAEVAQTLHTFVQEVVPGALT